MTEDRKWWLFTILLITSLWLFGCSPQKRLNRKLDRAERFANKRELVISDTLVITDTVIIESFKTDTVTNLVTRDTVTVINNERVLLRYFYDTTRLVSEIWHEVECKQDTIYREIKVPVTRIKKVQDTHYAKYIFILAILILALLLYRWSKKEE